MDPLTKKKFSSENTYNSYVSSNKYKELVRQSGQPAPQPVVTLRRAAPDAGASQRCGQPWGDDAFLLKTAGQQCNNKPSASFFWQVMRSGASLLQQARRPSPSTQPMASMTQHAHGDRCSNFEDGVYASCHITLERCMIFGTHHPPVLPSGR